MKKLTSKLLDAKRLRQGLMALITLGLISTASVMACLVPANPNCPASYSGCPLQSLGATYNGQSGVSTSGALTPYDGGPNNECVYLCPSGPISPVHSIFATGVCTGTGSGSGGGGGIQ